MQRALRSVEQTAVNSPIVMCRGRSGRSRRSKEAKKKICFRTRESPSRVFSFQLNGLAWIPRAYRIRRIICPDFVTRFLYRFQTTHGVTSYIKRWRPSQMTQRKKYSPPTFRTITPEQARQILADGRSLSAEEAEELLKSLGTNT